MALLRPGAAWFEVDGHGVERGGNRFEWSRILGRRRKGRDEHLAELVLAEKEHFALVGKVAKEGALGQPGAFSDLGDRGLLETSLDLEFHRGHLESTAGVGLPPTHGTMIQDDSG